MKLTNNDEKIDSFANFSLGGGQSTRSDIYENKYLRQENWNFQIKTTKNQRVAYLGYFWSF